MQHPKHLSQMAATGSMTPLESSDINIVSDIDGTTNRVASVTLESDSLSETPKSFRNKRRKRLPKREKFMRLDNDGKEQRQPSTTTSISNSDREDNPANKIQMEWENILAATTESAISETEFSSDGTNADADDEQSDWREFNDLQLNSQTHGHLKDLKALITDGNLSDDIIRRIECFALDSDEKELILTQVYHSTQIKNILKDSPTIKILKRGRGRVILKKA